MTFKPTPEPADPESSPPGEGLRMAMEEPHAGSDWLRARRRLALELPALAAVCWLVTELAPAAETSGVGARTLWVACFALFSMALHDFVRRALDVLEWLCPRCAEPFCGSLPFRARCAHCDFEPGKRQGRGEV